MIKINPYYKRFLAVSQINSANLCTSKFDLVNSSKNHKHNLPK
ncbi:hypothetical protein EJK55_2048 [Moraxella catarrhalis]|uniref:Uncharacterized protein n=1 Tax=Moraxella catarrhalis TaxID=480 RepID=A0ABY0BLB9_MORCA|nr:hypothetical protein EJK50_1377 [Moraxella catarrhalis]RUO16556.1 hypothetical protein EJK55_2048 [Moraxella catarrhalis]RUO17346.1 hypothetical protein EJK54_2076 [Moraxella catarrhalis]